MPAFPLITHSRVQDCIAWRNGELITVARFLADVARVRAALPAGRHVLNACTDRYHFMVGLAAAVSSGRISLLPSTQTPEVQRQLQAFAPDVFCLTDRPQPAFLLPQLPFSELDAPGQPVEEEAGHAVPWIEGAQVVAHVFTSGSTGRPVPHAKTWGGLVQNVRAEAQLWHMNGHAVVGTVPAQHMYGFESTVLVVMQGGGSLVAAPTFYPADICAALAAAPRPRILVSTPVHLRALLQAGLSLPPADLLVSATAPLSPELAREAEAAFGAPLFEIYGSTETSQIALRHASQTREWTLFPGVRLHQEEGVTWVHGPHLTQPVASSDVIEQLSEERFVLHGRHADMVNLAGKRNSLAYLTLQLAAIAGVEDGVFYMPPEEEPQAVTRLVAFVVAPSLTAEALMQALRERIDPVFLPRPLHFVSRLPRNAAGKLPHSALVQLHQSLSYSREPGHG